MDPIAVEWRQRSCTGPLPAADGTVHGLASVSCCCYCCLRCSAAGSGTAATMNCGPAEVVFGVADHTCQAFPTPEKVNNNKNMSTS